MKITKLISESIGVEELTTILKNYIETNNKLLLLSIQDMISHIPELQQKVKSYNYKYVYRGLAINDDSSLDKIKLNEIDNQFVATSPSKDVATEYSKYGNPKRSILIKYEINNDSVLFDTRILKNILNKITDRYADEVVINLEKAKFVTIEQI